MIPLAGAALLGVAAALVANPVLLQLGTVTGKRKRRDLTGNGQELAYKGYKKWFIWRILIFCVIFIILSLQKKTI